MRRYNYPCEVRVNETLYPATIEAITEYAPGEGLDETITIRFARPLWIDDETIHISLEWEGGNERVNIRPFQARVQPGGLVGFVSNMRDTPFVPLVEPAPAGD